MIPRRRWRTALGWVVWSLLLLLCWLVVALAVVGAVHLLDRADPAGCYLVRRPVVPEDLDRWPQTDNCAERTRNDAQ